MLTNEKISDLFIEEIASQITPEDVEVYIRPMGTLYVVRFHNKDGGRVPALDAFMVMEFHDGSRDAERTSDPEEVTAFSNLYR
jgi:hypothetical protein